MKLVVVVPCHNEQAVLCESFERLRSELDALLDQDLLTGWSLVLVDDGSKDGTWQLIEDLAKGHASVRGIKLSRNFGHQNALLAGLAADRGDAFVTIDADLQDDPGAIRAMWMAFREGCDVVYGVRRNRSSDSWYKRMTALLFYRLASLSGVDLVHNHADYRLLSARAVRELQKFGEVNLFLRGMVPYLGFGTREVHYDRTPRTGGASSYNFSRMLRLALDGITSFSTFPLRVVAILGGIIFLASLGISGWVLWIRFVSGDAVPGWASTVLPDYLLGGLQIFCLGIIGEYVGRIYLETKARPRFIVERTTGAPRAED